MGIFSAFRTPSVHADEARRMVADGATLLDVREKQEWNAGHAPGAVHVPLSRIAEAPRRVRSGQPIVVACRSGNRSRSATAQLIKAGLPAVNLRGGMRAWEADGGRVVGNGNRPGAII